MHASSSQVDFISDGDDDEDTRLYVFMCVCVYVSLVISAPFVRMIP